MTAPSAALRRTAEALHAIAARPRMVAAGALLLFTAGCDPFNTGFDDLEEPVLYRARTLSPAPAPSGGIRVMTYNVKYGGARLRFFWECDGTRYHMTEDEVRANLDALAARIRAEAPDVVLLQEIDTDGSKRAAYVDQVQYLLDRTGLNHGAYASQWKADYVPSDGLGPVDSGNAVLSRWPIDEATRHSLALLEDASTIERYFYLKRNVLEVGLAVPGLEPPLTIVATHTEAFASDGTKKKHIDRFREIMDDLAARDRLVVGGGDLNELPPTVAADAPERAAFPEDAGCTDARFENDTYVGEETWLDGLYAGYEPETSLADLATDPGPHHTFVGDERYPLNRKLDYLFTNGSWVPGSARTLQDAILLSDHVPVVADLVVP